MTAADDRLAAISLLSSLGDGDKREIASLTDPRDVAQLLRSYVLASERVDRSLLGQVEAYLSTLTPQDWLALLKSAASLLIP